MTTTLTDRLAPIGRIFFALSIVAFGLLHFIYGDFVTRVVPSWPAWIPARTLWAYVVGSALVVAGTALLFQFKARTVAFALGGCIFLSFLFFHLPAVVADGLWGGKWTSAGKALTMCAGTMATIVWLDSARKRDAARARAVGSSAELEEILLMIGRIFFGAFLTLCGIQHFIWEQFVVTLVPAWIPAPMFWTHFAGVALVAAGFGLVIPKTARPAALLTGAMIFVWFIVLHIPRAFAAASSANRANEVTAVFEAFGFSGIAFMLAGRPALRAKEVVQENAAMSRARV